MPDTRSEINMPSAQGDNHESPASANRSWDQFLELLGMGEPGAVASVWNSASETPSHDVVASIEKLSLLDRELLTRFYVNEETNEDICRDLGLSTTQLELAKAALRVRVRQALRISRGSGSQPGGLALEQLQIAQAPVFMRALEVFGDSELAIAWMEEPNTALGGLRPIIALLRETERAEVFRVLGRIEHGVLS